MKILVAYPSREELSRIVELNTNPDEVQLAKVMDRSEIAAIQMFSRQVIVAPHVQEYAIELIMATQPGSNHAPEVTKRYIRYGSSPRGAQALIECGRVLAFMRGRMHLSTEDITRIARPVLRHRLILNFDAHAEGETSDSVLEKLLKHTGR